MTPARTRADARVRLRSGDVWRFLTNVPLVLGASGILAMGVIALFGPQLAPSDPHAQRVVIFYPDGTFASPPTPPDRYNPLGTDPIGRDQLSRLLWGARLTVTIILLGLLGRGLLALLLGVLAGWRSHTWIDEAIRHVTNAVGGVPQLMLALLLVIALQDHGVIGFVLALALVGWADLARFVRSEVIRIADAPHVHAARALGANGAHVVRTHVLRDLTPQLLGLLAIEAGSVLLLLAELGFIGMFISGGVFFTSDSGAPVLPVRDRAPEWGQMLAGARNYAFSHQYVAFVPGLVVVGAVLAFNLFAEGLRAASDPFGSRRVSPRTLGRVVRALALAGVVACLAFAYLAVRSTSLSFSEGLGRAQDTVAQAFPGGKLVAAVVRLSSSSHALAQPERLTYYFVGDGSQLFRVSFLDGDANAIDAKLFANEDDLVVDALHPLDTAGIVDWEVALRLAEDRVGSRFRSQAPSYRVRVLLTHEVGADRPSYRVQYTGNVGAPVVEVRVDALTGGPGVAPTRQP